MPDVPKLNSDEADEDERADVTRLGASEQPSDAPLRGYLTVIVGENPGQMFVLERPVMTLGRSPECDVRLDSDGVSRKHARILREAGNYRIEDASSTNGTWVDGKPASAEPLRSGSRIRVGTDVVVRFNLLDDAEAALQQRLYENVIQDTLTGAYNKRYFDQSLATEVTQANRLATPLALMIVQVDDMKRINEYYTQAGGDALLRKLTKLVQDTARAEDVFARIGPDRFALIARGLAAVEGREMAEKIRAGVERLEVLWQSGDFSMCIDQVTASLSLTAIDAVPQPRTTGALLEEAMSRLQRAKQGGGNVVVGDP